MQLNEYGAGLIGRAVLKNTIESMHAGVPVNAPTEGAGMVIQCNIRSIVEDARTEKKLRQAAAVSRAFAQAEWQRRLTREIHDTVIQDLSLVNIRLGNVAKAVTHGELLMARTALASAREMLDEGIAKCRGLMSNLTPPLLHELGLQPALDELIKKLSQHNGTMISLECGAEIRTISHAARGVLFDATRELIVNAVKHAGPCSIHCSITQDDGHVCVLVQDDGVGFNTEPAVVGKQGAEMGFGIYNTRERVEGMGGRLEICSVPGHGTSATLTMFLGGAARD